MLIVIMQQGHFGVIILFKPPFRRGLKFYIQLFKP